MKRGVSLATIAGLSLAVVACDNTGDQMAANGKLCATWKTTSANANTAAANANVSAADVQNGIAPGAAVGDASSPVDICVKHWAYSLAGSRDSADVVADAAVAACAPAVSNWNQGALAQGGGAGGSDQSISTVTGEPTNAMTEHANFARGQALLYVVEARAGHCKPPPLVNGQPVGA